MTTRPRPTLLAGPQTPESEPRGSVPPRRRGDAHCVSSSQPLSLQHVQGQGVNPVLETYGLGTGMKQHLAVDLENQIDLRPCRTVRPEQR